MTKQCSTKDCIKPADVVLNDVHYLCAKCGLKKQKENE